MELTPERTAVLAVHLQGDIAGDGAFSPVFGAEVAARRTVDRVAELANGARQAGAQVVWTRVAWQPDYSDLDANSPLLQMVVQFDALQEGSANAELLVAVARQPQDIVHTHKRLGGLTPDLVAQLREAGIQTLVFCGVATNASVEGTARQASDEGFTVVIAEDACSAATPQAHQASIESMGLIGFVMPSEEILAALAAG